jgi:fermentation-respiration switch protein FrsA (DUF1100 family)
MSGITMTLAVALALYLLLALVMFGFQRSFLYHPDTSRPDLEGAGVAGLTEVRLESEPGLEVAHWYRPPAAKDGPVLVVFHGNAGHIGHRVPKFRAFLDAGFGLFLAEYRGYGGNAGKPDEAGLTADARAVMTYLGREGIAGDRLIVFGESLGGGPAVKMAVEFPVAGLVLESPFTSVADVAQALYWFLPARWMVRDPWDNAARIGRLRAPLLLLHGENDHVVPVRFGRRLFDEAPEPKQALFVPDGAHNDLFDYPEVIDAVMAFVREWAPARQD